MPSGWSAAVLRDHIHVKHGFGFKSEYFTTDGPYALLTPGNFYDDGGFKPQGDKQKRYDGPVLAEFILRPGDLVVAMTEQAEGLLGSSALVPEGDKYLHNQRIGLVTSQTVELRFLYYLFNYRPVRAQISASASGAKVRHTSPSRIGEVHFILPPLNLQRRIVETLSAYDDLIELNTRRIAILEEMARRVFDESFVRFRAHATVRSINKKSNTLPEGWTRVTLGQILDKLESGSRPRGGVGGDGDVPSIGAENVIGLGRYDYAKEKFVSREFFKAMRRGHVRDGDVMLYKDGAYIGRLSIAWANFPHAECAVNEHVFLLRAIPTVPPQFLYFWLNRPELQAKIRGLNANAAQPGLNQPGVKSLPIIVPPATLLEEFNGRTRPTFDLLFNLATQNRNLKSARDLLLPKLMSGEIDFSDAERGGKAAAGQAAE